MALLERIRWNELVSDGPPFRRTGKEPGVLVRLDAVYNISRHRYGGLAVERSGGIFRFIDLDGTATPYLCWRRTEGHAFLPQPLSIDNEVMDMQPHHGLPPGIPPVHSFGLATPRVHAFNSDRVEDWLAGCREKIPLGAQLLVNAGGATAAQTEKMLVCLAAGGDAVFPAKFLGELGGVEKMFGRVEEFEGFAVCLDKKEKKGKAVKVDAVSSPFHAGRDGLRQWIACRA